MKFRKPAPISTREQRPAPVTAVNPLPTESVVLPFEDRAAFEAARNAFMQQFRPATDMELLLVEDVAAAHWRLRRAEHMQTTWMSAQLQKTTATDPVLALEAIMNSPAMRMLQRYEARERRAYESAWRKLTDLQKDRNKQHSSAPQPTRPAHQQPRERTSVAEGMPPGVIHEPSPPPAAHMNGHRPAASSQ